MIKGIHLGKNVGLEGIKEVYHVEVAVTENGTVNFFLFKDGHPLSPAEMSPEEKEFLKGELKSVVDDMLN